MSLAEAVALLKTRKATVVFFPTYVSVMYPGQKRSATANTLTEATELAEQRREE